MYGIFMESWVIFKLYGGNGWLTVLYLAAMIFLFRREKSRPVRVIFLWLPLAILLLFFFPLFRRVYVRFTGSGDTQYRMLWLLPMGMTVAAAGCRAATLVRMRGEKLLLKRIFVRLLAPALVALAIVLCGSLVYRNPYVRPAENPYHIPQEAIEVADIIVPEPGKGRVRAAVPSDLVHFIRQYNTDIILAFGRDIIAYDYYNEVHEKLEKTDVIVMSELSGALREAQVDYLVLKKDRPVDTSPESEGWMPYGETDEYMVYIDSDKDGAS